MLHNTFLANLRRARQEAAQIEVAERLGIKPPSYSAIESGKSCPSIKQIEKVATAIGVSPLELLGATKNVIA